MIGDTDIRALCGEMDRERAWHSRHTPLSVAHGSVANDQVVQALELFLKLRDTPGLGREHAVLAGHYHGKPAQSVPPEEAAQKQEHLLISVHVPAPCHAHLRVALLSKRRERHRACVQGSGEVVAAEARVAEVGPFGRRCHRERKRSVVK